MTEPIKAFGERIEIVGSAGPRSLTVKINGQELHSVRDISFYAAADESSSIATITFYAGEVVIDAAAWLELQAIATKATKPQGPRLLGQREEGET